jgi:radical SAM superfamily enzyme YgiQ (UPF0313 family)
MTTTIYLADLRHNYGGILSSDAMPLCVGYMKAVMDRDFADDDVDVQVFAYPDDLLETMERRRPDILMVSNYVWNEKLSLLFCRKAKRMNPGALTVMGGPNIPVEPERQVAYFDDQPDVDIYVLGEGDFLARDIAQHFMRSGLDLDKFRNREIPSCIYSRPDGRTIRNEQWGRNGGGDVNDIPSPYLTGVMDKFFDGKMAPFIETNRGCPFKCSFCVQGTDYYNKITHFDLDRMHDEIHYIARKIKETSPDMGTLRIADANYGMYKRDTEISSYIGETQREYGYPTFIDATTGKNRPENIIKSMEQVNGALVLYQAVQSLDEDVLRNIRRSNIKLSAYEELQVHVRGRGLRTNSDLILGLPGETFESHIGALHKLIDAGTNQAHCFQALMLKGSDMETEETRSQFEFDTKWRVLPKNFGEYGGEKVFDVDNIIIGTDTLSFEDYLKCRKHHVTFSVFWNDSWFIDVVRFAQSFGVKPSEWLCAMLEAMEADTGFARQFLDEFIAETKGELFDTYEECSEFYSQPETFEKLRRGDIGDNLMYKYRARASFFLWKEFCELTMRATEKMLRDRGVPEKIVGFDDLWNDLHLYVEAKHATGISSEDLTTPAEVLLTHDIRRWIADEQPHDVARYRTATPQTYVFRLTDEGIREIEAALRVWTPKLAGLTKLVTRIRVASQVRECTPADADAGFVSEAVA